MENVEISMKQQFLTYGVKLCITVSKKLFQSVWIDSEGFIDYVIKEWGARCPRKIRNQQLVSFSKRLRRTTLLVLNNSGIEKRNFQQKTRNIETYFFQKQETLQHKKHPNKNFSGKARNIETRNIKTKSIEHKIECMLQTHPPKSCEVPRCRNDEMKPNARRAWTTHMRAKTK